MQRLQNPGIVRTVSLRLLRGGGGGGGTTIMDSLRAPSCDVFINHRGIDTKKTFAGLLFQYLSSQGVSCFLDSKNMKPGDRLFENIDGGIRGCKVGVAILSPRYCESAYCLHELALMMEMNKRVVPVFYDVKPSQLRAMVTRRAYSREDLRRYNTAIDKVRNIVGLTFDSSQQDWSELLREASIAVMKKLVEVEDEAQALKASYIRSPL